MIGSQQGKSLPKKFTEKAIMKTNNLNKELSVLLTKAQSSEKFSTADLDTEDKCGVINIDEKKISKENSMKDNTIDEENHLRINTIEKCKNIEKYYYYY